MKVKEYLKKNWRWILSGLFIVFFIVSISLVVYLYNLNKEIKSSLDKKNFALSVEFYSQPESISVLEKTSLEDIKRLYADSFPKEELRDLPTEECFLLSNIDQNISNCIKMDFPSSAKSPGSYLVALNNSEVAYIYDLEEEKNVFQISFKPLLFAQYYNNKPVLKRTIEIGDAPPLCLNAILAIEDNEFLEHKGFNVKSIMRAVLKNLQEGRKAQGASTITQQLVKNYFLSHEKTFSRKFKELFMAVLLETQFHKDEILEAYINEIYMGQNAAFEVRGLGAASEHYFRESIEDLDLAECALLAAIINSPGRYNPQTKAANALQRRNLVLSRLLDLEIITQKEFDNASNDPLPRIDTKKLNDPAPYFIEAAMLQIENLGIEKQNGLKVFTTMNTKAQNTAKEAVTYGLKRIQNNYKNRLPKNSEDLQGILISANPVNGYVTSLVGGANYQLYPYNRALHSHRQVGSTMKVFVYLSALESFTSEGQPYNPLSPLQDIRFKYDYEGQSWSPKNYKNKTYGEIPLFFALKNSLNLATADLALKTGLESIVQVAKKMGIQSEMKPVPSLSLGAFEIYPWELLQAYTTIARMGSFIPLTYVERVQDQNDKILYEHLPQSKQVYSKTKVAVLVGMMKQVIENGTAQLSRILGFKQSAAGKTGTTSDSKDAWFVGFTPHTLALSWVGFDDNRTHNLTGASGALPIWTHFMKSYNSKFPDLDFEWPEGTYKISLPDFQLEALGIPAEEAEKMGSIELIMEE